MIESLYSKDFENCEDVNEILFKAVMIEDRITMEDQTLVQRLTFWMFMQN